MTWYESQLKGLGLDLLAEVEKAVDKIRQDPQVWPRHKASDFRKYKTKRFPFLIFYREMPDCIWIAAIAHAKRKPDYWKKRSFP